MTTWWPAEWLHEPWWQWVYWLSAIAGLVLVSVFTRSFFFVVGRTSEMPEWLQDGLRYAPLAALAAVVAPDIVLTKGAFQPSWQDARLWSAALATAYAFWRRDMLGTILLGMGAYLALRLGMGW